MTTPRVRIGGMPATILAGVVAIVVHAAPVRADVAVAATVDRNRVAVGQQVYLQITVTSSGDGRTQPAVRPPDPPDLPTVTVAGPHGPSTSQEVSIINGRTTRKITLTYAYYLVPRERGSVTIPALDVVVDGQTRRTQPIRLTVTKSEVGSNEQPLEMCVRLSRNNACLGQAIICEYLLYEQNTSDLRVSNRQIGQEPKFTGFWVETLHDARQTQSSPEQEIVNGVPYVKIIVFRFALFPQRTGTLTIPPLELTARIALPTGQRNFWGQPVYQQRDVAARSPVREIEALPLPPNPPPGFAGAVGTFRLTSTVDRSEVSQGDPVTWIVELEGEGNLGAAGDLVIPPLQGLRAYDPKSETAVSYSGERYGGKKTTERVVIPLHSGVVDIPPASFVYFDTGAGEYRTIASRRHRLTVSPRAAQQAVSPTIGVAQTQIRQVGRDIRFLQPDVDVLTDDRRSIWHSRAYWALQAIPVMALFAAAGLRWRRRRIGGDVARMRATGAAREARKRLKAARVLLKKGELQRAIAALDSSLSELIADHANLSAAGLTSNAIRSILMERAIPEDVVELTLDVLGRCDRARYAPSALSEEVAHQLYQATYTTIRQLARHLNR